MKGVKKLRGIEQLKNRYGHMFTLPWLIGIVIFFIIPLVQSVWYSFSKISVVENGIETKFIGLDNYKQILQADPNYTKWLSSGITSFFYTLPLIILVSMVLAMLLNQKFVGRLFFRALYFLPVIIASGVVMSLVFQTTSSDMGSMGVSDTYTSNMFSVNDIIGWLQVNGKVAEYVILVINKIFDLVWQSGIQTVLFLAGLQSIPSTLYEASKVEGATKWEEFWFITFPMLSQVTLLVAVFTMVEIMTNTRSTIISNIYKMMSSGVYDETSAMIWFYFLVGGGLMALVLFLYNRFLMKRWE